MRYFVADVPEPATATTAVLAALLFTVRRMRRASRGAARQAARCNNAAAQCIIMGRVFVRLLTAIPLLFWVGSAAVVHFVHACVAAPVVASDVATGDPAFESAPAPADALVDTGNTFTFETEHHGHYAAQPPQAEGHAQTSAGSRTIREQVFASARLFANPPPFAA